MPIEISNTQLLVLFLVGMGCMYFFYTDGYEVGKKEGKVHREQEINMEMRQMEEESQMAAAAAAAPPPEPEPTREPYQPMSMGSGFG